MGGHQTPGPLCGHKVGKGWIDDGTTCRARTSSPGPVGHRATAAEVKRRNLAAALHAQDARELLRTQLPAVLEIMTDAQIRQMQMVFDAAVIDPEILKDAKKYYDRAGVSTSQGYAIWDEALQHKADRIMAGYITVEKWDKRIRLEYEKLLEPNALKPITDNPDEAAYLDAIRKTLANRGVWLQYDVQRVRDPEDPSSRILDPHKFGVWLTLGLDGDTIPTKTGKLTRETILKTTELGAGYYERVFLGPVQKGLEREMSRLDNEIAGGLSQHQMLAKIRRDAPPLVAGISDLLGGADFPDESIWNPPYSFVLRARTFNTGGNVKASQAFLVTAALLTRTCAQVLADYIDKTSSGAERAVKVLKVAKTAGEIAGVVLTVTGVVGIARAGAAAVAEGGAAATTSEVDVLAKKVVDRYVAENPELANELSNVRWVRGPKGSIGGFVKPNHSYGLGSGWQKWP